MCTIESLFYLASFADLCRVMGRCIACEGAFVSECVPLLQSVALEYLRAATTANVSVCQELGCSMTLSLHYLWLPASMSSVFTA